MHALQKLCGDRITISRTDDGIYWAFRAKGGLVFIDPFNDVKRMDRTRRIGMVASLELELA